METEGAAALHQEKRAAPSTAMPQATKEAIDDYFLEHTRASADTKNVVGRCTGRNQREFHAKHWRDCTIKELWEGFKKKLPSLPVSFSSFYRRLPFFVKKVTQRFTCMCPQCTVVYNMVAAPEGGAGQRRVHC